MTTTDLQYMTYKADERSTEAFKMIEHINSVVHGEVNKKKGSQGFVSVCKDVLRCPNRDSNVSAISSKTDVFGRTLIAAMADAIKVPENDTGDSNDAKRFFNAISRKFNVDKFKGLLATVDPSAMKNDKTIEALQADLLRKDATIDEKNKMLAQKDATIEETNKKLAEQEQLLATIGENKITAEQEKKLLATIDEKNKMLAQKDKITAEQEQLLAQEKQKLLATIDETNKKLAEQQQLLAQEQQKLLATIDEKNKITAQHEQLLAQKEATIDETKKKLAELTEEHDKLLDAMREAPDDSPARNFVSSLIASPSANGRKRPLEETGETTEQFLEAKQIESIAFVKKDKVKNRIKVFDESIEGIDLELFSKLPHKKMRNPNETLRSFFKTSDGTILQVDFDPTNKHILVFTPGGVLPDKFFKNTLAQSINDTTSLPSESVQPTPLPPDAEMGLSQEGEMGEESDVSHAMTEARDALASEKDYFKQIGNKCIWNYQRTQTFICTIGDEVVHDFEGAGKLLSCDADNFIVDGIDGPKTAGHFRPDVIMKNGDTVTWYYKGQGTAVCHGWQTAGADTTVTHDFVGEGTIERIDTMTIKINSIEAPLDRHAFYVRPPTASFTVEVEHVPANKSAAKDDPVYGPAVVSGIDIDSFTTHYNLKKLKGDQFKNHVRTRFTVQSTNKGTDGLISGGVYVVVVDVAPDNKVSIYKTGEDEVKNFATDILEYIKNELSDDGMLVE